VLTTHVCGHSAPDFKSSVLNWLLHFGDCEHAILKMCTYKSRSDGYWCRLQAACRKL
jgi:hypothetical protein